MAQAPLCSESIRRAMGSTCRCYDTLAIGMNEFAGYSGVATGALVAVYLAAA